MDGEKRFSGKMGQEYDLLKRAYPKYDELHQVLAGLVSAQGAADPGKKLRILEIGCGSGITTEYLLGAGHDLVVTAIDDEPMMVLKARSNLGHYLKTGVLKIERADALEFLQSTSGKNFDVVASGFTLHNFLGRYRSEVLGHIFHVLRPGGLFVNADKYALEGQDFFDGLVRQLERFFNAFVPLGKIELLKEWVLHNVADMAPDRIMKEKVALAEMEKIGFEDARVHFRHGLEAVVSGKKPVRGT